MFTVLFFLAVALITVVGAELSRSSYRRLLQQPVRRNPTTQLASLD